jgi:MSHA pilin protein MshD
MNTGQMMITISALMLLSTVILNVNRNALTSTINMAEAKYEILAVSVGTALIEEAFSKAFDERTAEDYLAENYTDLSVNLGPESGETSRALFDDFDDYNGYKDSTDLDTTVISADLNFECKVYYVDPDVSLDSVGSRTWHKKIVVYVTSPFINEGKDTIVLSKINSHFYFR